MSFLSIFKFGEQLPYEKDIGMALIVLGLALILFFQMEPSIPAKATSSSKKASPAKAKKVVEDEEDASPVPKKAAPRARSRARSTSKSPKEKTPAKSPATRKRGKTPTKK